jgi:hypothetical protein
LEEVCKVFERKIIRFPSVLGTPTSSLLLTPQQSPVPAAEQQLQQSPYSSTPTQLLPKGQTTDWTIEDVIQFIAITDPTLAVHADLFRKHVSVRFHRKIGHVLTFLP